ncbi:PepSY-associated TM helix domain-containing protein [Actinophytocola oryzae]|uniref:Putative iron-regulated membrane protein n=1 Tax=Actinophytocola oryzae TaxID=502181 RepID=A0A4R7V4B7_9PSEU|nr:PepSY-associated TM helix domain-containing protein [Actinophytocola oryzae]TDV44268.1 putative iron-regulated membrane protein [Actinophytocola oryzae]
MSEQVDSRVDQEPPEPDELPVPSQRGRNFSWWSDLRPLVLRLHFYVGVLVGPFILVAAITGLLYTITPQLDQIMYDDALHVPVGTNQLDLRDQVEAASAAVPNGTVTEIRPPIAPDSTTRVTFAAPGVAEDYARTAFVDPYTGKVTAVLDTFGEWLPARAWIDTLHRTLHLGQVGRMYTELAASWLWVLALSGIAIWTVRRRRTAKVRRTLLPERSARGRARLRSWHGSVGLWIAIGMLVLSVTGLTWSTFAGANVSALRADLDWTTPQVSQELPTGSGTAAATDPDELGETADRVLAAAHEAGMTDPVAITPAAEAGQAWRVAQVKRSLPLRQDAMAIDPSTGQVLDTVRFADWPLMAQAATAGISLHMGILFGITNQLLLVVLAVGIIFVVLWGYRMWWLRRPTRPGATAPGGKLKPSAASVGVAAAVAIALGVFFPVFGVSLLAFLVGDALWQHLRPPRPGVPEDADDTADAPGAQLR